MRELLERAHAQTELFSAAELLVREAAAWQAQAGTLHNPVLGLEGGSVRTGGGDRIFGTGGAGSSTAFQARVSQSFYFPGRLDLRSELAGLEVDLARLSSEQLRRHVDARVIRLAYAFRAADQVTQHVSHRVERFRIMQAYLNGRPFLSPQSRAERDIVEQRLRLLEQELAEMLAMRERLWLRLNVYLVYPSEPELRLSWFSDGVSFDRADFLASALMNNPELKERRILLEQRQIEQRLARIYAYPDFAISAIYSSQNGSEREQYFGLGIEMPIPLFDRGSHHTDVARARLESERSALQFFERELQAQMEEQLRTHELALQRLRRFPLERLNEVRTRSLRLDRDFRTGRVALLTYMEADGEAFESVRAVLQAQVEYVESHTRLLLLAGRSNLEPTNTAATEEVR
ncbi:MAG: TolC family protein [Spirochaetales bacterium]|nr:TolC family protein [Leptospiraceae bacterium]MCP5483120.1 TolC family protein [Spirochaetales bacterium]MCP5484560.1 TolC family protein [Spirochaetales bacterium]